MMTEAEKKIENDFFDRKIKYMDLFKGKKYEEAWDFCLHTFDMFSEPMYEQPLVYLLVEDIVKYSIETQQYEIGNKYLELI